MSEPSTRPETPHGDDVFALDNIRLDLPYAGAGSRVMAGIIDYGLFYSLALALSLATITVLAIVGGGGMVETLGGWVVAIALLVFFLLEAFYFAVQEMTMDGQTLGKRALGLRTLAAQGHEASKVALLLRNLVRSVDIVLGAWFLVFDRRSRRLGDRLAGTVVVHETGESGASVVERVPRGWGVEEIRVAEELLDRLYFLDNERARRLASDLLERIERDDPDFLRDVPTDLAPTLRLAAAFGARL